MNPICQSCHATCLTCSSSSLENDCVTCNPLNFRSIRSDKKCTCIDGYLEQTAFN